MISMRRGAPVTRPVVVMSIVWPWPRARARAGSSVVAVGGVDAVSGIRASFVVGVRIVDDATIMPCRGSRYKASDALPLRPHLGLVRALARLVRRQRVG